MTAEPDLKYQVTDAGAASVFDNIAGSPQRSNEERVYNRDLASIQTTPGEKSKPPTDRVSLFQDETEEEKKEAEPTQNKLLDTITIQKEENDILAKERALMLKAKELENEMLAVRKAKIDSVLRQFEQ